jgi:MSHA biogenesis protein MshO
MRQEFKLSYKYFRGFTLVELVIVIAVTAILGGISSTFIRHSVLAYVNSEAYYELADRGDIALRRMSRDIRNALPNSIWVPTVGAEKGTYVQFIPIVAGGRYQQDSFDFSAPAGDTFDVLGPPIESVVNGDRLAIYNLGIDGADAYSSGTGSTTRLLNPGSNLTQLTYTGAAFPQPSPANRFYIVNSSVFYVCDVPNRRLLMYSNYPITSGHPANFNGLTARVVIQDVTECSFIYSEGVMQHTGVVTALLKLEKNGGVVRLVNLINVVNSP